MNILVLGGAGYVGSHTVRQLLDVGEQVVVVDNLQTGHRAAVDRRATFFEGDVRDSAVLNKVFSSFAVDVVIHFAASSLVGESMKHPVQYYDNNVGGAIALLQAMADHNVRAIVFSSTAATYGQVQSVPIRESDPTLPSNPYGETKLAMERMFHWADRAYGIKYVSLRYFNAAGADASGEIGEDHDPETHLIPLVLEVALDQREYVAVYGTDYDTKDGTCIRDYIHVCDLADAHIQATHYLLNGGSSDIFNLGNGIGFSVREVIDTAREITQCNILQKDAPRRPGDPAILVASSEKARHVLDWQPQFTSLGSIIQSAWTWHSGHPHGYGEGM